MLTCGYNRVAGGARARCVDPSAHNIGGLGIEKGAFDGHGRRIDIICFWSRRRHVRSSSIVWCIVPQFSSRLVLWYRRRLRGGVRCRGKFGRPLFPFGSCGWRASNDCLQRVVGLRGGIDALR